MLGVQSIHQIALDEVEEVNTALVAPFREIEEKLPKVVEVDGALLWRVACIARSSGSTFALGLGLVPWRALVQPLGLLLCPGASGTFRALLELRNNLTGLRLEKAAESLDGGLHLLARIIEQVLDAPFVPIGHGRSVPRVHDFADFALLCPASPRNKFLIAMSALLKLLGPVQGKLLAAGAAGVGVGSAVNRLQDELAMVAVVRGLRDALGSAVATRV